MRTLRLFIILLILVTSLTIGIGHSEIFGAREKSMQVKEEIELEIGYFILPPEEYWGTNVRFRISIPELLNLPKYEHLVSMEYRMIRQGGKALMNLNLTFRGNVLTGIADNVSKEILQAFNHTMLHTIYKSGPINNTSVIHFLYQFGSLPYSVETVLDFLKHKPETGFAKLINENFLSIYIPGNATKGIVYLAYDWKRGSSWHLTVESSLNVPYSPSKKTVDLNELIGNEEPITTTRGLIKVYVWNWTLGTRKYVFRVLHVSPSNYHIKKNKESITYEWILEDSIQNVIVDLEANKISAFHQTNPIVYLMITTILTLVIIGVIIIRHRNKS